MSWSLQCSSLRSVLLQKVSTRRAARWHSVRMILQISGAVAPRRNVHRSRKKSISKILSISTWEITEISSIEFKAEARGLEYLDLSNNSLKSISMGAFFSVDNLKVLKLSDNQLDQQVIEDRVFFRECSDRVVPESQPDWGVEPTERLLYNIREHVGGTGSEPKPDLQHWP